jgi:hypothetical protein
MSVGKENADPELLGKADSKSAPASTEVNETLVAASTGTTVKGAIQKTIQVPPETPVEPPKDPRLRRRVLPNPLVDDIDHDQLERGVLIPLKTTQEVRQDHTIVQALITRAPTKSANDVLA